MDSGLCRPCLRPVLCEFQCGVVVRNDAASWSDGLRKEGRGLSSLGGQFITAFNLNVPSVIPREGLVSISRPL